MSFEESSERIYYRSPRRLGAIILGTALIQGAGILGKAAIKGYFNWAGEDYRRAVKSDIYGGLGILLRDDSLMDKSICLLSENNHQEPKEQGMLK